MFLLETTFIPGPCSEYITEKFDSPRYSKRSSIYKKIAASIEGCQLPSKEQFWLAEPVAILEEPFASEVHDATEADLERKLAQKLLRSHVGGVPWTAAQVWFAYPDVGHDATEADWLVLILHGGWVESICTVHKLHHFAHRIAHCHIIVGAQVLHRLSEVRKEDAS